MAAGGPPLPDALLAAASDREHGASAIARRAIDGLLEVAGDRRLLEAGAAVLLAGQPAMAPIWHVARAARGPQAASALAELRRRLDAETEASVEAAVAWLRARDATVRTVSRSSLVDRVLECLEPGAGPLLGVVGADAVGPAAILNATGTAALARQLPTLVVTTSIKLVPAEVFDRLGAPGFEVIPLAAVAAVVVGDQTLAPAEAGARAAAPG